MESGAEDTLVTLVIKDSDQNHEDRTINCFLSWTVEKLKSHIATVCPSKPCSRDQLLVYSGKLLHDHLRLRDVLQQHDKYPILHLVCNFQTPSDSPAPWSTSETAQSALSDSTGASGDLRRRGGTVNIPQSPAGVPQTPHGGGRLPLQGGQMLTPMQMFWWQQMYVRHYYMQYQAAVVAYQPPSFPSVASEPPPPRPNEAVQPPLAPVPAADPLPENLALRPAPNANIQMNVQGGGGGDGLNEVELNRDWLDWLYVFFRICILVSFVYYNCSFSRLIVVVVVMMLVYLYQKGWFPFRMPERQHQEPPVFQVPEQARAQEEAEMQRGIRELERVMDDGTEEAEREAPSLLNTAWSFVRTFFTSLIPEGRPQRPPPVPRPR